MSLGCPKNLVDSEVMMGQLVAKGHELTPHPDQADVLVVNTCSFIDPAKKESIDTILEMAEHKKFGRAQRLVGRLARDFPREHEPCPIGSDRALDTAIITAPEARDPALLKKLDAVAGRILRA